MSKEKTKALEVAIGQIDKHFGAGAIMRLGDSLLTTNIDAIHTGSIALDMALGVGGIPRGRVVEVFGAEASGKSTLAYHIMAEAQRNGGTAAYIDAEHAVVLGAKSVGGLVVGISPALTLEEHVNKYHSPTRGYDTIIYTGSGLMGREIENIRTCDVVIFAGGRSGSLGEFAIAYDEGKVIGALQGTGGIADRLDEIIDMVRKKTEAYVCHHSDPETLLDDLENVYRERILPGYLKTIDGHNPDGVLDL